MAGESLDDILDDSKTAKPVEAEAEPEIEEEEPLQEPEMSEDDLDADPEPQQPEPKESGLHAALTEARSKAREAEERANAAEASQRTLAERLEAIERRFQQPQQQEQPKRQALPDVLENPEGFSQTLEQRLAMMEANFAANLSERTARMQHGDGFVDEAFQAAQQQGIVDRFRTSQDPWGELARWHKDQKDLSAVREAGGIDKLREQLKAELQAELQASAVADSVQAPAKGPSLATQPNLGRRPASEPFVDQSLKDILGNPHDL